jgi:hypothetical protein
VISQCHFSIYVGCEVDGCCSIRTFSPLILLIVLHSFECKSACGNCHITLCVCVCVSVFACFGGMTVFPILLLSVPSAVYKNRDIPTLVQGTVATQSSV